MTALLLMLLGGQHASMDAELEAYRAMTLVAPACSAPTGEEIPVCGRRRADRYRVPLIESAPATDGVPAERERLLAQSNNCREKRLFLTGCGMAGASVSTTFGASGTGKPRVRTLGQ